MRTLARLTKNESGGKTTKRGQTKKKGERETEKQNWKVKFCKKKQETVWSSLKGC